MSKTNTNPVFEVFFDGECPLCMREIRMLRRLDRHERIRFTDIAEPTFDASSVGVPLQTLMAKIHGRALGQRGELVEGVEVFRQLYTAVGFGPLVALSRLWGVRGVLDHSYEWFAANRLWLTGRPADSCETGRCEVRPPAAASPSDPITLTR